jgi:hypothetical protein
VKLAIVTRADDNVKEMASISHPILKNLASDWGADFIVLSGGAPVTTFDNHQHFNIVQCRNLLKTYDRIFMIDSDTIPTPKLENIFETVPVTHIGTIFEDVGSRQSDRRACIMRANNKFGELPTKWRTGYINTGVFVFSKEHAFIFDSINGDYYTDWGTDDIHIGYQIRRFDFPIYQFDPSYNFMVMFDEPWNCNAYGNIPSRLDQKIIHYAGNPSKWATTKEEGMRKDYKAIYG